MAIRIGLVLAGLAVLIFVWMFRYEFMLVNRFPIRYDRLTGRIETFAEEDNKWVPMRYPKTLLEGK